MLREVCSCGASITADDPHTITQSRVEDWRANHRHDVSKIETSGHDYTVDDDALLSLIKQQRRAASTEHAKPVEHLDHCRDLYCGGCEVDTEDDYLLPDGGTDSVAPAGEEHVAPEPPAGTPVWWDGRWWHGGPGLPYYCTTGPLDEHCWSEMPGAVPALTPEQQRGGYLNGHKDGFKDGREAAARDVEALMRWRGVWVDADDAVRAARGQA